MRKGLILKWTVAGLLASNIALYPVVAQEHATPADAPPPGHPADILKMLNEDLAGAGEKPSQEDADHLLRLKRLYDLKSEVIVEPSGAALQNPSAAPSTVELDIYELDEEIEILWKEIADLRRTINEMNGHSFRQEPEPEAPGITEPIPFDSEPDPNGPVDNP
jgi:hypothetical protein